MGGGPTQDVLVHQQTGYMATGSVGSEPTPQLQGQDHSQDQSPVPGGVGPQSQHPHTDSTENDNTGAVITVIDSVQGYTRGNTVFEMSKLAAS